ncbi:MAG TPA: CPBP family intramembrane glutamic endopeptidase [Burkholderiaceae bacterium]
MNFFSSCTAQLGRQHPLVFVYVVWILSYGVLMPLAYLDSLHPHDALHATGGPRNMPAFALPARLVLGSFIVPAFETAMFQWAPLRLLHNWLKLPRWLAIAASALLFGAAHGYSSGYMVFTTLIGVVLAWAYVARDYDGGRAYLWIGAVHAMRNAVSALLM